MAEAVAAVATAVMVISVAAMAFAFFEKWARFAVPYAGAGVVFGAMINILGTSNIPMTLGIAGGSALLTFLPLQTTFGQKYSKRTFDPSELTNTAMYPAIMLTAGVAAGAMGAFSTSEAAVTLAAGAGAFIGYKFVWNQLVNGLIDLGLIGPKCGAGQDPVQHQCITSCHPDPKAAKALDNDPMCAQYSNWCKQRKAFLLNCPDGRKPNNPGASPGVFSGGPGGAGCTSYGMFNTGTWNFGSDWDTMCATQPLSAARSGTLKTHDITNNWDIDQTRVHTYQEFLDAWKEHELAKYGGDTSKVSVRPWIETKSDGSMRCRGTLWTSWRRWIKLLDGDPVSRSGVKENVALPYAQFGPACNPAWYDESKPPGQRYTRAERQKDVPLDVQPLDKDRNAFVCPKYDHEARDPLKVARVKPSSDGTRYSCITRDGQSYEEGLPKGGVEFPTVAIASY